MDGAENAQTYTYTIWPESTRRVREGGRRIYAGRFDTISFRAHNGGCGGLQTICTNTAVYCTTQHSWASAYCTTLMLAGGDDDDRAAAKRLNRAA